MKSLLKAIGIALSIQVLSASMAQAGFLRLVPEIEAETAENNPGLVQIVGTLENQGDERALDVRIEEAKTSKILADMKDFAPGEKKDVLITVPESELGLSGEGSFVLPMRVLYKDANKVGFSAAFVLNYFRRSESGTLGRSSPITIGLEESRQQQRSIDVGMSGDFKLVLLNTSQEEVVGQIDFVSSKELEFKAENTEFRIPPQSEQRVQVEVTNKGALVGSSYATYALVKGQLGGQAFADYTAFLVNVVTNTPTSWTAIAMIFLALSFTIIGFIYWRKEQTRTDTVTVSGGGRVIEPEPLDTDHKT